MYSIINNSSIHSNRQRSGGGTGVLVVLFSFFTHPNEQLIVDYVA